MDGEIAERTDHFARSIGAAVIDENDLKVFEGLAAQSLKAFLQTFSHVMSDHGYSDKGH